MSTRKEYLRLRREWLVSKAAAERSAVACDASHLQKSLRWVDAGFAVGQVLRTHPVLVLTGVSLLLRTARTRRLLWAGQLFTAWELFSMVRKQWPRRQV